MSSYKDTKYSQRVLLERYPFDMTVDLIFSEKMQRAYEKIHSTQDISEIKTTMTKWARNKFIQDVRRRLQCFSWRSVVAVESQVRTV